MNNKFKHLTILYVEDDGMICTQAQKYLEKFCKKVWVAQDGIEALGLYEDYSPDIIISDIKMPRLDGLSMTYKIRQTDKNTPIIITTAFTDTAYLLKAVELQLVKYLIKPITSTKLLNALELAYKQLRQETSNIILINDLYTYDTFNKILLYQDEIVKLTKKERLLIELLATNSHRTVTYKEIENYIWMDTYMSIDTLRSLVKSLRKKLDGVMVENISGLGYRLKI